MIRPCLPKPRHVIEEQRIGQNASNSRNPNKTAHHPKSTTRFLISGLFPSTLASPESEKAGSSSHVVSEFSTIVSVTIEASLSSERDCKIAGAETSFESSMGESTAVDEAASSGGSRVAGSIVLGGSSTAAGEGCCSAVSGSAVFWAETPFVPMTAALAPPRFDLFFAMVLKR